MCVSSDIDEFKWESVSIYFRTCSLSFRRTKMDRWSLFPINYYVDMLSMRRADRFPHRNKYYGIESIMCALLSHEPTKRSFIFTARSKSVSAYLEFIDRIELQSNARYLSEWGFRFNFIASIALFVQKMSANDSSQSIAWIDAGYPEYCEYWRVAS